MLYMVDSNQLVQLIVNTKVASAEQVEAILVQARKKGKRFEEVLLESSLVSEDQLAILVAESFQLDFVDLNFYHINTTALSYLNPTLARRYRCIPIDIQKDRLVVAMAEPSNLVALDDLRAITDKDIEVVVATSSGILASINRFYRLDSETDLISAQAVFEATSTDDLATVREVMQDSPIVKLVNMLIEQAVVDRASDIHVEPGEQDLRVRYRIDGVLHEKRRLPRNIQSGIISRLKIMSDLDIAERRIPQDGRMSFSWGGLNLDLRVATLPTVYGEKIVMRILDKANALLKLSDLGFLPTSMAQYEKAYTKPYGTILITGPTGSGKSTTLYATLNQLNDESRNVITVEDPVEYRLEGINQVQVNPKAGLNFASALRSILRSDPDVILIGEIRDKETATIAIEASLTGHLVLSTLHTNDAASTPSRLVEMGVETFLVASALDCIVAQRLARRLCPHCKESYVPSEAEFIASGWNRDSLPEKSFELKRPKGCALCSNTGYKGRLAIQEVLTISEHIERMIVERASSEEVRKVGIEEGMIPLIQAGFSQALKGVTSLEEILRVIA